MGTVFKLFAVSPPGLEEITSEELKRLGITGKLMKGGVEFKGKLIDIYRCNLWLRTANRILVRVARFKATTFRELVERISRYPWEIYINEKTPIKIRVTSRRSKLYHTKAIAERIIEGISKRVKFTPVLAQTEEEGESLIVRVEKDFFTVSVNSSGTMLYKRGYRKDVGEAPLRETFAAAMLLIAGYNGEKPLIDPFCGSGTIPIEAALICTNTPPGMYRGFAFESWRIHSPSLWEEVKEEAKSKMKGCSAPIYGFDLNPKVLKSAAENASRAKMNSFITFKRASFPSLKMEEAYIVTNPPYGIRIPIKDTENLYRKLGNWVRQNFKRAKVVLLSPLPQYVKATKLPLKRITSFSHGGIRVGVYVGDVE